jgi:plastocyanin
MSNRARTAPIICRGESILARLAALIVLLAFELLTFAHLCNATGTESISAAAKADGKTVEIIISNFTFAPSELTIAPGTTVKWVNQDDIPHLVAEKTLAFKSQALDANDSFSFTFRKPGTVEYFCVLHPHMVGRILVEEGKV